LFPPQKNLRLCHTGCRSIPAMSSCLPVNVSSPEGGLLDELTLFVGFCLGKRDPGKNSSILFTGECTPENFRPNVVGGREMVADFLEDFIYFVYR